MAETPGFKQLSSESADEQNMAQIREILFGEQNRKTSSELNEIAERLEAQDAALRKLLDSRLTQVIESLQGDIDKQGVRHQASLHGIDNALRALIQGVDEKINMVDSDAHDAQHALRQSLEALTADHEQLKADGVQRTQLAELLEAMASKLRAPDGS